MSLPTIAQVNVLETLYRSAGHNLGMSRTVTIKAMLNKGWIEAFTLDAKTWADASQGRRKRYRLTALGNEVYARTKTERKPRFNERSRRTNSPCVVCGSPVPTVEFMVEVVDGGSRFSGKEEEVDESDPGYMGYFPVGQSCVKRLAFHKVIKVNP